MTGARDRRHFSEACISLYKSIMGGAKCSHAVVKADYIQSGN